MHKIVDLNDEPRRSTSHHQRVIKRRNTDRRPFIAATCKPCKEAKNNELLASSVLPSRTSQETRCRYNQFSYFSLDVTLTLPLRAK